MKTVFQKQLLRLSRIMAVVLTLGTIAFSVSAYADDPLCDNNLWIQMTQRARLNGQQDLSRAENLIYKADSILEYSCLSQFVDVVPVHAPYYQTADFTNNAVQPVIESWIQQNFGHTYLGGRNATDQAAAGGGGSYGCAAMHYVWQLAHCMNVGAIVPQDSLTGIYEFIGAPDVRRLPAACQAPDPAAFGLAPVSAATAVVTTNIVTANCGIPIPTGNVVDMSEAAPTAYAGVFPEFASATRRYNEKICSNPGCHYVPTAVNDGTCEPPNAPATP